MPTIVAPVPPQSAVGWADSLETEHLSERSVKTYGFGPFLFQPERQLLLKNGSPVRLGGRALDILTVLVEHAGELIDKKVLLSHVWPNTFVEEGNLKVNVAGLRRALGESPLNPQYIATVVGRGYRFIASIRYSGPPKHGSGAARPPTESIAGLLEAIEAIRHELEQSRTAT